MIKPIVQDDNLNKNKQRWLHRKLNSMSGGSVNVVTTLPEPSAEIEDQLYVLMSGDTATLNVVVKEDDDYVWKEISSNDAGIDSVVVTVDSTSGNPQGTATFEDGVLTLAFTGIKGEQGNTGSSVDYPFELVNNVTEGGVDKALSAEQGKLLKQLIDNIESTYATKTEVNEKEATINAEISQLGQEVTVFDGGVLPINDWANRYINTSSSGNHPFNSSATQPKEIVNIRGIKLQKGCKLKITIAAGYYLNIYTFKEGYPSGEAPTVVSLSNASGQTDMERTIFSGGGMVHFGLKKYSGSTALDILPADSSNLSIHVYGISDYKSMYLMGVPVHYGNGMSVEYGQYYTTDKKAISIKTEDGGKQVLPTPADEGMAYNIPADAIIDLDGEHCFYIDGELVPIVNIKDLEPFKYPINWVQGTNGTTPGTIAASGIRCVAFAKANAPCNILYSIANGYSVIVKEWNDGDETFYGPLGWFGGEGVYTTAKKNVSFVLKKNDDSAITPADITPAKIQILVSDDYSVAIDYFSKEIKKSFQITPITNFVQGTVQTSGANIGQIVSSAMRCVAVLDLPNGTGISAVIAPGYKAGLSCYSDGDEQTTSTGFKEGNTTFETFGEHAYLIVGKVDNSNIIPSEAIANVVSCSTIDGNPILLNIKSIEDDVYDRDRNGVNYVGEALPFGRKMIIKDYMTIANWSNSQGGAIYGDYLVTCMAIDEVADNTTNGHIYNIKTGALVSELIFGYTMGGIDYEKPHANEVCFGKKFYNSDSRFPLLYVSQVRDSGASAGIKGGVMVYDLQYDEQNTKYVPVLVQVIMPDTSDTDLMDVWGKYTPNYIVDTDHDALYVLNYPKATWFDLAGNTYLCKFDLPDPDNASVVTLTYSDLKDHYELPNCYGLQMTFYYGGKLYISGGYGGINNLKVVRVWDLVAKCETTKIDLSRVLADEPQFIGLYGNRFLWYSAGTSGKILEFIF